MPGAERRERALKDFSRSKSEIKRDNIYIFILFIIFIYYEVHFTPFSVAVQFQIQDS